MRTARVVFVRRDYRDMVFFLLRHTDTTVRSILLISKQNEANTTFIIVEKKTIFLASCLVFFILGLGPSIVYRKK